jgi:hypothetical protein
MSQKWRFKKCPQKRHSFDLWEIRNPNIEIRNKSNYLMIKIQNLFKQGLPEFDSMTELARIVHELSSRDRENGRSTWQLQGLRTRGALHSTSQGA